MDPQGHSSLGLGIKSENLTGSVYDVFDETSEKRTTIHDVRIVLSDFLHVVPSEVVLSAVEQQLAGVPDRENKLWQKLEGLDAEYDFVLIDCPPNLGLLTFNALRASKELIIPVECSSYSLHGLTKIIETVKLLEEVLTHKLVVHAVLNDFDLRTRFSRRVQEELQRLFATQLFKTVLHHSVRLREAAACGKSICDYDRQSIVFRDFLNLGAEVIEEESMPQREVTLNVFDIPEFDSFESSVQTATPASEEKEEESPVLLTMKAPGARYVQVAGDFNHWIPEDLLPPIKEGGIWRKLYRLKPGTYKYKFIVDGEWMADPHNHRSEPNPFGGIDSVLDIGGRQVLDARG